MAAICSDFDRLEAEIEDRGFVSVLDPACGAGALLVAFANECHRQGINYQRRVLFIAQDIDHTVGCMCYIALSLMGCPGYVVVGDSLAHPAVFHDERGLFPVDNGNVWYTPMVMASEEWTARKIAAMFGRKAPGLGDKLQKNCQTPAEMRNGDAGATIKREPETPREPKEAALDENEFGQLTFF